MSPSSHSTTFLVECQDICRLLDKTLLMQSSPISLNGTLVRHQLCNLFHNLFIHKHKLHFKKDGQGYFLYTNNTVIGERLVLGRPGGEYWPEQ